MEPVIPLLKNSDQRQIQETLLRYGIVPSAAHAVTMAELRHWPLDQLLSTLEKVSNPGPDLRSFNFGSTGIVSQLTALLGGMGKPYWMKAPLDLVERSAKDCLALCVNAAGDWSLRKDGYVAISHVWEEGIQADSQNRGIPLHHIRQILERIHETKAEWVWLDGLAIPGASRALTLREEELKADIINNLASIYKGADAVIIFDALVMRLQSTELLDVAVTLLCGRWPTRIWTYQEICLAKRALVVTGTGIVEFVDVVRLLGHLSGNEGHLPEILGAEALLADPSSPALNPQQYEEIYLTFARLTFKGGKKPSLTTLALACYQRNTGNDIDYARAFFPVLGLTWNASLTREEGMKIIYDSQRYYAKRLILMHGSPRTSFTPGWAPSYLTGLMGGPIEPEDTLGDIEWEKRGLRRSWYTYKVKANHPTDYTSGLFLELDSGETEGTLCGCEISTREREESVNGFSDAVTRGLAYILSDNTLSFPTKSGFGINVMLVERNEEVTDANEAWVYLTGSVTCIAKALSAPLDNWLLLHESPISTHYLSGKGMSRLTRSMIDEETLHKDQSPLHAAVQGNHASALHQLLASGEDVEGRDVKGWTPLHSAAFRGHVSIVGTLLQHGAIVDSRDYAGRSSLTIAADGGHTDVAKELLRNGADVNFSSKETWSPLNQALISSHHDMAKLLMDAGADPTNQDRYGFAPLLLASNDLNLVNLLLEAGADPNTDLVGGATVLHYAARHGNVPLLKYLLATGMDVNLPQGYSEDGITALYNAVKEQHEEAVRTLLEHGADPNKTFKDSWTCIIHGAKIGNYKILQMMLSKGGDARARCDPEGSTALHIAVQHGHRMAVRLLLETGWDVNAKDASDTTPLQIAIAAGFSTIVEVLRKAGAS